MEEKKLTGYFCGKRKVYRTDTCSNVKNTAAAIIYTGGPTGISKGTILSNDSLKAMALQSIYDASRLYEGY